MTTFRTGWKALIVSLLLVPPLFERSLHAQSQSESNAVHSDSPRISRPDEIAQEGPNVKDLPSWRNTVTALGVVVVVILMILPLVRRFSRSTAAYLHPDAIQILGRSSIDSRNLIYVVRCGPRVLILGATSGGLTTLAEIAEPDEIEEFTTLCHTSHLSARGSSTSLGVTRGPSALREQLDGLQEKFDGWKLAI